MDEDILEFIVQKQPDGGYLAQSMGACIITEADDLESLRREICDAVCCHFEDDCKPANVKLRFVEVVSEELLKP